MKHTLFLLFFLVQAVSIQAQTLRGTVVDRATGRAIPGVLVYLDGTSTQTITDADGKFSLTPRGFINTSLVFSHLTYNTLAFRNPFSDLPERIGMDIKPRDIDPVTVRPVPFSRAELMQVFRENFLGTTRAGLSCRIENEKDIRFGLDYDNKILTAHCDVPLRIRNTFLGYDILFNLMVFNMHLVSTTFLTSDGSITQFYGASVYTDRREGIRRFERRRESTHEISTNAFFIDLAWEPHGQSDFVLFRDRRKLQRFEMKELPVTITDSLSVKVLTVDTTPTVVDLNSSNAIETWLTFEVGNRKTLAVGISTIFFMTDRLVVDRFGNLDNELGVMTREGVWGMQRLGDMLPLDFEPLRDW